MYEPAVNDAMTTALNIKLHFLFVVIINNILKVFFFFKTLTKKKSEVLVHAFTLFTIAFD